MIGVVIGLFFPQLFMFSLINMCYPSLSSVVQVLSLVEASAFVICVVFALILLFQNSFIDTEFSILLRLKLRFFYYGYRARSNIELVDLFLFLKIILLSAAMIFFNNNPTIQLALFIIIHLFVWLVHFNLRAFNSSYQQK